MVPKPLIALLVGPSGAGKTTMACGIKGKKLLIDLDAKADQMANLGPMVDSGELAIWPVTSGLIEEPLTARAMRLIKEKASTGQEPKGFLEFCRLSSRVDTDETAEKATTWIIDPLTRLGEHLRRFICHHNNVPTLRPRDYGTFLTAMEEVIVQWKTTALRRQKNLIFTVHQRSIEIPEDDVTVKKESDAKGNTVEKVEGTFSLRKVPALDGQISEKLGSFFNEVFILSAGPSNVPAERGKMRYLARTVPDGQSDARTSRRLDSFIPADLNYVLEH